MDYVSKNSSKYLILFHVILVTKYRHNILNDLEVDLKRIILDVSKKKSFKIETMEIDKDHIHILISTKPNIKISSIIRVIKQITTNRLWKLYPEYLRKFYWERKILWSKGKFICTIGNASESTIRNYIESQG